MNKSGEAWLAWLKTVRDTDVFIDQTVGMTEEERSRTLFKARLEGKMIDLEFQYRPNNLLDFHAQWYKFRKQYLNIT